MDEHLLPARQCEHLERHQHFELLARTLRQPPGRLGRICWLKENNGRCKCQSLLPEDSVAPALASSLPVLQVCLWFLDLASEIVLAGFLSPPHEAKHPGHIERHDSQRIS